MNGSLFTADRGTHLKIVLTALVAAMAVSLVAATALRSDEPGGTTLASTQRMVVRAGEPARYTIRQDAAVR